MISCCNCESNSFEVDYRVIEDHQLKKCIKCGMVYLGTRTDPDKFIDEVKKQLYRDDKGLEYWSFPEMYRKYSFVFKKFFKERLARCLRYNPEIKSAFDIGSGYGFWMDYCRNQGLEVNGIDISGEAIGYAKDILHLDVEKSDLKDFDFKKKFDLYTYCDVLEHQEDPNQDLRIIYKEMKPASLLYIQVPDVLGFRIPYKHNLGLPHHIWQFNYKTLKMLLEKNGFRILKRWHGVQGVIGAYERGGPSVKELITWWMARTFKVGNRLQVIAQKTLNRH